MPTERGHALCVATPTAESPTPTLIPFYVHKLSDVIAYPHPKTCPFFCPTL